MMQLNEQNGLPGYMTSALRRACRGYLVVAILFGWAVSPGQAVQADDHSSLAVFGISFGRDNGEMMQTVAPLTRTVEQSVVQILCGGRPVALGTIVDDDGYVLTKRSELNGDPIRVRLADRRLVPARMAAVRRNNDLALLKIDDQSGIKAVEWVDSTPKSGGFLVSSGRAGRPIGIGVVGARPRPIAHTGRLGVVLREDAQGGALVDIIIPGSGAARAGVEKRDRIVAVNGKQQSNVSSVMSILHSMYPGEFVKLTIEREGSTIDVDARMRELAIMQESENDAKVNGPRNTRLSGFDDVIQHDTVLGPDECGGPVLDSRGQVVGINIARAGRVVSYALPASLVRSESERMLSEARAHAN